MRSRLMWYQDNIEYFGFHLKFPLFAYKKQFVKFTPQGLTEDQMKFIRLQKSMQVNIARDRTSFLGLRTTKFDVATRPP